MKKSLVLIGAVALTLGACSEQGKDKQATTDNNPATSSEVGSTAPATEQKGITDKAMEAGTKAWETTKQTTSDVVQGSKEMAGTAVDSTKAAAGDVANATGQAVETVKQKAGEAYQTVKEKASDMVSSAKQKMGSEAPTAPEAPAMPESMPKQQ